MREQVILECTEAAKEGIGNGTRLPTNVNEESPPSTR